MKTFEQYLNEGQSFLRSISKNDTVDADIDADTLNDILKQNPTLPVVFERDGKYYDCTCNTIDKQICIDEGTEYDHIHIMFSDNGSLLAEDIIDRINSSSWRIAFINSRVMYINASKRNKTQRIVFYSCKIVKDKYMGDVYIIKFDLVDENI